MKKIISLFLVVICLFSLTSCVEIVPQKETWSTWTKEKAYEIFPKYAQEVEKILSDLVILRFFAFNHLNG